MISFEVEGADEASANLDDLASSITQEIANALREAADLVIDYAQANAPVDTGNLRDSISVTDSSDTSITVTSEAGYSGFVEYGTRHMDSQPFFEPAIAQAIPQIERLIADAISGGR